MPPVDASSTTTPNLWSTLPSTSVLASKRKETVLKAFSIVHHERGDARLGHGAEGSPRRVFRHCDGSNGSKVTFFNFRYVWRVLKAVSFALGPVLIDDTSRLQ